MPHAFRTYRLFSFVALPTLNQRTHWHVITVGAMTSSRSGGVRGKEIRAVGTTAWWQRSPVAGRRRLRQRNRQHRLQAKPQHSSTHLANYAHRVFGPSTRHGHGPVFEVLLAVHCFSLNPCLQRQLVLVQVQATTHGLPLIGLQFSDEAYHSLTAAEYREYSNHFCCSILSSSWAMQATKSFLQCVK